MRNPQNRPWMICGLFLCCLHLYLLLTTAWVADDAFITFRTIDHFLQGDGPRFNVQERVQTYTHPLWFLCLSFLSYFSGEIYYTTLFFSVSLAMTGLGMLVHGLAPKWEGRLLALGLVCFSKAYVEYSTSGLENPLSHILLAFFVWIWCKNKSSIWLFGTAGLLLLNRLDLGVLLAIPLFVHVDQHRSGKTVLAAMVGFLPLLVWELFSMVYYGFPFPNTAYAKLFSTGLSRWELVQQGGFYLLNGLRVDPVTIVGIGLGVGFSLGERNPKTWPLALGGLAYLGYVVWIGGDFMAGRFLSTPFWLAVLLLARRDWSLTRPLWLVLISGIGLVGLFSPDPPVFSGPLYGTGNRPLVYPNQISNERAFFYQQTGLRAMQRRDFSFQNASSQKREVLVYSKLGIPAFTAPRNAHVIDFFALADPLLARLPSLDLVNQPPLKMGHHPRFLPAGYIQALETGENHLRDPALAAYYEQLRLITRGPVWSRARFGAIGRMHFGRWGAEIDHDFYRNPTRIRVKESEVPAMPDFSAPWYAAANVLFSAQGLSVLLEGIVYPETVELGFYQGGEYEVILVKDGEAVERHPVDLEYGEDGRQQVVAISLSPAARAVGITEVQVMPMALRHWQVLGFLRFQ